MTKIDLMEERLTRSVIGAFFEVYNPLGFVDEKLVVETKATARGIRLIRFIRHIRVEPSNLDARDDAARWG